MIIGSGMMSRSFAGTLGEEPGVVVYGAGVSNSRCTDQREFERERTRLAAALDAHADADRFLYFSTCSIDDRELRDSDYVCHKLRMEEMVRRHRAHLVFRLPQVAGRTPNPNTLLNYLYARIVRAERFVVWTRARRNIIDVEDVRRLALAFVDSGRRGATINLANEADAGMPEIVRTFERVTDSRAVYDEVERGGSYRIDVSDQRSLLRKAGVEFHPGYLEQVLRKYYGS